MPHNCVAGQSRCRNFIVSSICLTSSTFVATMSHGQLGVPLSLPVPLNSTATSDSGQDRDVDIAVDSLGRWVAVWESSTNLNGSGTDYDIFTARSLDNGMTWSATKTLNTNANSDGIAVDREPRLFVDPSGVWIATWMSHSNPGGEIGMDFDVLMAISIDAGLSWTSPTTPNLNSTTDKGHDFDPVIRIGDAWVAVWRTIDSLVGTIGPDAELLYARRNIGESAWSPPVPLNSGAAQDISQDAFPQLAYRDGVWICVWQANHNYGTDYDIMFSRSTDAATTWTPVAPLNSTALLDGSAADNNPQLCVNEQGIWVAVWSSTNTLGGTLGSDRDLLISRSTDAGLTWSAPVPLHAGFASDDGEDEFPRLACDNQGTLIVTWQSTSTLGGTLGSDLDIFVSKSTDGGLNWSAPIAANINAGSDSGDDLLPRVAAFNGAWTIAWQSHDTMGGTIGPDADLLLARFALPDCNENTVADLLDQDANLNGVPDDCEASPCAADIAPIGGDGQINVDDLLALINAWGACSGCAADLVPPSGNGQINVDDLLAMINNWGPCE